MGEKSGEPKGRERGGGGGAPASFEKEDGETEDHCGCKRPCKSFRQENGPKRAFYGILKTGGREALRDFAKLMFQNFFREIQGFEDPPDPTKCDVTNVSCES